MTIAGQLFRHLFFQFVLVLSGWRWVGLAFGETFEALIQGLQGALWELGGVPSVLRHDNLSAATHELASSGGRSLNRRFADVLEQAGPARCGPLARRFTMVMTRARYPASRCGPLCS